MAEQPKVLDLNARCGGGGRNAWEDPSLPGMNRLLPHSRNVRSMAAAYKGRPRKHDTKKARTRKEEGDGVAVPCVCLDTSSLEAAAEDDGVTSERGWRFRLFPNPECIPEGYVLPNTSNDSIGKDDGDAGSKFCGKKASVPSNWTMESHKECCGVHDPPRYTNVQMPFDVLYPHVPHDNPTGVYRLEFSALPNFWVQTGGLRGERHRRRVVIHLGAVEGCHFVYLNGNFVGMGKDARLPNEFDVTPFVNSRPPDGADGTNVKVEGNVLVVIALKWSDGSFLEQQDHWRGMGGIHRSVFLYSTPGEAYLEDVLGGPIARNSRQTDRFRFRHKRSRLSRPIPIGL